MTSKTLTRRAFLSGASSLAATSACLSIAAAPIGARAQSDIAAPLVRTSAQAPADLRTVSLIHRSTAEKYRGVYYADGAYIPEVMELLNWTLRDIRVDKAHVMHPALIDVLSRVQHAFDLSELVVTSAYRSRETNEKLRRRTGMAARNSLHIEGMAADVYSTAVGARRLAQAAMSTCPGGVGYYPRHRFVHVDVGPYRRWRG